MMQKVNLIENEHHFITMVAWPFDSLLCLCNKQVTYSLISCIYQMLSNYLLRGSRNIGTKQNIELPFSDMAFFSFIFSINFIQVFRVNCAKHVNLYSMLSELFHHLARNLNFIAFLADQIFFLPN